MTRFNVYYTGRFSQSVIACIDAVNVVSNVDRVNSDGTGVAVLDCEEGWETHVSEALNDLEQVQSFFIRH